MEEPQPNVTLINLSNSFQTAIYGHEKARNVSFHKLLKRIVRNWLTVR